MTGNPRMVTVSIVDRTVARALCDAAQAALRDGRRQFEHLGRTYTASAVCDGSGIEIVGSDGKFVARRVRLG